MKTNFNNFTKSDLDQLVLKGILSCTIEKVYDDEDGYFIGTEYVYAHDGKDVAWKFIDSYYTQQI